MKIVLQISLVLVCLTTQAQNFHKIDSLRALLKADSDNPDALINIFKEFYHCDKDSSLYYAERALTVSLEKGDSINIVRSLHARGDLRIQFNFVFEGINDLERALAIANRNQFLERAKYILNVLSIAHQSIANYDKALEFNFQSLRIREKIGNMVEVSVSQNNIGTVYFSMDDYEKAMLFFEKSLKTKLDNNIEYDLARCYSNIGLTAIELRDFKKAVESLNSAFSSFNHCKVSCDKKILMEAHFALGKAYHEIGEIKKAIIEFNKSIAIADSLSIPTYKALSLNRLSRIQLYKNDPQGALALINESQDLLSNSNYRDDILSNYEVLIDIYKQLGDFERIAFYQQKYLDLYKEIYGTKLVKSISQIQSEYDEWENLKTIAEKDQILALQEEIIDRQRWQYFSVVAIAVLLVGLTLVMFRVNRFQKRINKILDSRVKERTKELVARNHELASGVLEQELINTRIADQIRATKATLLGLIHTASKDLEDNPEAEGYLKKMKTEADKLDLSHLDRAKLIDQ